MQWTVLSMMKTLIWIQSAMDNQTCHKKISLHSKYVPILNQVFIHSVCVYRTEITMEQIEKLKSIFPKDEILSEQEQGYNMTSELIITDIDDHGLPTSLNSVNISKRTKQEFIKSQEQRDCVSWGLPRIINHDQNLPPCPILPDCGHLPPYFYDSEATGQNVNVIILGTELDIGHPDFQGRAKNGPNFSQSNKHGYWQTHGTHAASVIGGDHFGIAKNANIIGVRLFGDTRNTDSFTVFKGLEYAFEFQKTSSFPVVLLATFIGPKSIILNHIFEVLGESIYIVVPAGHSGRNACEFSPSSVSNILVATPSDRHERILYKEGYRYYEYAAANYGQCVSLIAPGDQIFAGRPRFPKSPIAPFDIRWGSLPAASHVAGAIVVLISKFQIMNKTIPTPIEMKEYLIQTSSKGFIKNISKERPINNYLLYIDPEFRP